MADVVEIEGRRPGSEETGETLRHLHELAYHNIREAVNFMSRGMAFYLAILAASLGYAVSQSMTEPLRLLVLGGALAFTLLYLFGTIWWLWATYQMITTLQELTSAMKPQVPVSVDADRPFRTWRRVGVWSMFCIVAGACVLVAAMVLLRMNPEWCAAP